MQPKWLICQKEQAVNTQSTEDEEANHRKLTFRCSDLKIKVCEWHTSSDTEDEVLRRVEEHFRGRHGFTLDAATRILVRRAIGKQQPTPVR
jgi:predicted small metal-binding protein